MDAADRRRVRRLPARRPRSAGRAIWRIATRLFWFAVLVNLVYSAAALGLLVALVPAVAELRTARFERFDGASAPERYHAARERLTLVAGATAALAALPVVVALV